MSWRVNLRDIKKNGINYNASFRDVPFHVFDVDTGIGRRNIVHQYPGRDDAELEDLGLDADEFIINGYIIQCTENSFDYFYERDKLIEALKKEGSGTLIHPFLGEVTVGVSGKTRIVEDFNEGGIAKFEMTFVKVGLNESFSLGRRLGFHTSSILPKSTGDLIKKMDKAADNAKKSTWDEFVDKIISPAVKFRKLSMKLDGENLISKLKKSIIRVKGAYVVTVAQALGTLSKNMENINYILESPSDFADWIESSVNTFLNLIGVTEPVTGGTVGEWSGEFIGDYIALPGDSVPVTMGNSIVDALTTNMMEFGDDMDTIDITTDNRAEESLNRKYLVNAVKNVSLAMATKVAVRMQFDSYNGATETMDKIVDAINDQLTTLGDEAADTTYKDYGLRDDNSLMFTKLAELRSTFITVMKSLGASLAVIVDYECPPDGMTTLELAYNQYYDLDRADDIFRRNRPTVRHPGFLPGGQTIEILSA